MDLHPTARERSVRTIRGRSVGEGRMRNRPPHVVEVLYSFANGGSERIGSLLASQLAQAGWSIEVCATHSAHGPVADWLDEGGVAAHGLDVDAASRIGRRWRIYEFLRRKRPDVLHVQHFSILALCYWPARLAGIPRIVVTEHAENLLKRTPKEKRIAARYAARADLITVIHNGLRSHLVERMGVPKERVQIIPNGIDHRRFQPGADHTGLRRELAASSDERVIGCVARLNAAKDHATLFRALAALPAGTAPVRLALIGDGEERENLEELARRLGLEHRVRFLGDRTDVEKLLPQLDAFVLPSKTEGVPLVLLEAMACKVPCIATAVGGVPELLEDSAGVLVPPQQPAALADALRQLLEDDNHRHELAARGHERATGRFSLENMVTSYADALTVPAERSPT